MMTANEGYVYFFLDSSLTDVFKDKPTQPNQRSDSLNVCEDEDDKKEESQ